MNPVFVLAAEKSQVDLAGKVIDRLLEVTKIPFLYFDLDNAGYTTAWYAKPECIKKALHKYDRVCWLDNDIEILGNFDEIFEVSSYFAGCRDYLYPHSINTGVVVADYSALSLIEDWCRNSIGQLFRSDQEALDFTIGNPNEIHSLPMRYNHQRLAIKAGIHPNDCTKIIHWTGDEGKRILRKKHERELAEAGT